MADNLLKTIGDDGVYRIVLNQPDSRNALSLAMLSDLDKALDEARENTAARAIVIAANGPGFCAGHDLKELTAARKNEDSGKAFFEKTMTTCSKVMQKIVHHPLPVIAEVRGVATAAGCQIVASSDLAVAGEKARFATPGVHIGLFCSTPMVALSRNVPRKNAMEMLLTGELISAEKAEQIGLVNRAVKDDQVSAEIEKFTTAITSKSALTLKIGKTAFYQQVEMPLGDAYDLCARVMVENMMKRDAEEGINAFIEKRDPEWTNT